MTDLTDNQIAALHPVRRAANILGVSLAGLGKMLFDRNGRQGVSKAAINGWMKEGAVVPSEYVPQIVRLTQNQVTAGELNPLVDWAEIGKWPLATKSVRRVVREVAIHD